MHKNKKEKNEFRLKNCKRKKVEQCVCVYSHILFLLDILQYLHKES